MKLVNAPTLTHFIILTTATLLLHRHSAHSKRIIHPKVRPPTLQSLCISQFTLANHACAMIPTVFLTPSHQVAPPPPPPIDALFNSSLPTDPPARRRGHHKRGVGHHRQGVGHHNGTRDGHALQNGTHPGPAPQPEPAVLPGPPDQPGPAAQQGPATHHHRHNHETKLQRECCRWLKEVDHRCVCDLLMYLPVFLSRPAHGLSVMVDQDCQLEFRCRGRRYR